MGSSKLCNSCKIICFVDKIIRKNGLLYSWGRIIYPMPAPLRQFSTLTPLGLVLTLTPLGLVLTLTPLGLVLTLTPHSFFALCDGLICNNILGVRRCRERKSEGAIVGKKWRSHRLRRPDNLCSPYRPYRER